MYALCSYNKTSPFGGSVYLPHRIFHGQVNAKRAVQHILLARIDTRYPASKKRALRRPSFYIAPVSRRLQIITPFIMLGQIQAFCLVVTADTQTNRSLQGTQYNKADEPAPEDGGDHPGLLRQDLCTDACFEAQPSHGL